jgi:hypothetical protein
MGQAQAVVVISAAAWRAPAAGAVPGSLRAAPRRAGQ